jgi:hypothetical protein
MSRLYKLWSHAPRQKGDMLIVLVLMGARGQCEWVHNMPHDLLDHQASQKYACPGREGGHFIVNRIFWCALFRWFISSGLWRQMTKVLWNVTGLIPNCSVTVFTVKAVTTSNLKHLNRILLLIQTLSGVGYWHYICIDATVSSLTNNLHANSVYAASVTG